MIHSQHRWLFLTCMAAALFATLVNLPSPLDAQNASSWICYTEPMQQKIRDGGASAGFDSELAGSLSPTVGTDSVFDTRAGTSDAVVIGNAPTGSLDLTSSGIVANPMPRPRSTANTGLEPVDVDVPFVSGASESAALATNLAAGNQDGLLIEESGQGSRSNEAAEGLLAFGSPSGAHAPEPGSIALLGLGGIAILARRRRRV